MHRLIFKILVLMIMASAVMSLAVLFQKTRPFLLLCRLQLEERKMLANVNFIRFSSKLTERMNAEITDFFKFEDRLRTVYGLCRINEDLREVGIGGPASIRRDSQNSPSGDEPIDAATEAIGWNIEKLIRQVEFQEVSFSTLARFIQDQNNRFSQLPYAWPTYGDVTSKFGERVHPFLGIIAPHAGVDIANLVWTPVYATAPGMTEFAGFHGDFGNLIILRHEFGFSTFYGHLEKIEVTRGEVVKRGDLIGYIGASGRATGPHLHYEIRFSRTPVNPFSFILPSNLIVD